MTAEQQKNEEIDVWLARHLMYESSLMDEIIVQELKKKLGYTLSSDPLTYHFPKTWGKGSELYPAENYFNLPQKPVLELNTWHQFIEFVDSVDGYVFGSSLSYIAHQIGVPDKPLTFYINGDIDIGITTAAYEQLEAKYQLSSSTATPYIPAAGKFQRKTVMVNNLILDFQVSDAPLATYKKLFEESGTFLWAASYYHQGKMHEFMPGALDDLMFKRIRVLNTYDRYKHAPKLVKLLNTGAWSMVPSVNFTPDTRPIVQTGWKIFSWADNKLIGGYGNDWPTARMQASCKGEDKVLHLDAPDACGCGIYLHKDKPNLSRHCDSGKVVAQCTWWGKFVEHETGVRAEWCRIDKLYVQKKSLVDKLSRKYGVPVELLKEEAD